VLVFREVVERNVQRCLKQGIKRSGERKTIPTKGWEALFGKRFCRQPQVIPALDDLVRTGVTAGQVRLRRAASGAVSIEAPAVVQANELLATAAFFSAMARAIRLASIPSSRRLPLTGLV
jgi:hypothetical protein